VKIDVPASIICDGSPGKWNYIAMGSTNWVITYKALGCNPTCGCKTYKQKTDASCGCKTWNCKTTGCTEHYGSNNDAVNTTTCAKYKTCDSNECDEWDTKTDNTVRIYSLSGTDVSTGKTMSATCDYNGNCTF